MAAIVTQSVGQTSEPDSPLLSWSYTTKCFSFKLLVRPLKWWNSLAFILIQRVANDRPVPDVHLAMWSLLPCQRVFHPVLVIAFWVVLSSVGAARLLSVGCCCGCLCTVKNISKSGDGFPGNRYVRASQQIPQFKCLHQIRIPNHAPIFNANIVKRLVDIVDLLDALV